MKKISSLHNPLVKQVAALHRKKERDETGLFLVEGEIPCAEAIARGRECVTIFVQENHPHDPAIFGACEVVFVTADILQKISRKENPQEVIGLFRQYHEAVPRDADFTLALEEIRDPGNLGTILRTAHAVGCHQIVLVGPCCDPFAPEVIRASMGSFSAVSLVTMTGEAFLQWVREKGKKLLATDVTRADDFRNISYENSVVVMGNEQKGLSPALKKACLQAIHIPMPGGTESLNVAVASALVLYQSMIYAKK